jgi:hypothetical protein
MNALGALVALSICQRVNEARRGFDKLASLPLQANGAHARTCPQRNKGAEEQQLSFAGSNPAFHRATLEDGNRPVALLSTRVPGFPGDLECRGVVSLSPSRVPSAREPVQIIAWVCNTPSCRLYVEAVDALSRRAGLRGIQRVGCHYACKQPGHGMLVKGQFYCCFSIRSRSPCTWKHSRSNSLDAATCPPRSRRWKPHSSGKCATTAAPNHASSGWSHRPSRR